MNTLLLRRITIALALVSAIFDFNESLLAQKSYSALFIGNSYTYSNNLPGLISQVASSKGDQFTYSTQTPGGYSFSDHCRNQSTIQKIGGNYDFMILQGQSGELAGSYNGEAKHLSNSFAYAENLEQFKRLKDTCARTMLFMTWGYDNMNPQKYYDMQDRVSDNYINLAEVLEASVAPVGEAWRAIYQNAANPGLHQADQSHPTLKGSYLAACVFYTSIFHKSAVGAWGPSSISVSERNLLQQQAYNTVMGQLSLWGIDTIGSPCSSGALAHNNHLWETLKTNTNERFTDLQFTSTSVGFAQSSIGLHQTVDMGDHWNRIPLPISKSQAFQTHFVSDSVGFLISGKLWIDSTSIDTISDPFSIRYVGDHYYYPIMYRTVNGGVTWLRMAIDSSWVGGSYRTNLQSRLPRLTWVDLHFDNSQKGTFLFRHPYYSDTIFSVQTSDGGQTWNKNAGMVPGTLSRAKFISADSVLLSAVAFNDSAFVVFRTFDAGASWSAGLRVASNCCKTPSYRYLQAILVSDNGIVAGGNLLLPQFVSSKDLGNTWQDLGNVRFLGYMRDLLRLDQTTLWSIIDNPTNHRIFTSNDNGNSWKMDSYHSESLNVLTATDSYFYAAGHNGLILRRKLILLGSGESVVKNSDPIIAYPNPVSDRLFFNFEGLETNRSLRVSIFEINGREVDRIILEKNYNSYSVKGLKPGIYLFSIHLETRQRIENGRFIVK